MKHLFKPEWIKPAITVLVVFAVIKLLWVVVQSLWLPVSGVEHEQKSYVKNLYYRVSFASDKPGKTSVPNKVVKAEGSIKDISLLAIYSASQKAVITIEHKKKTHILATGDEINGFVLQGAGSDYATFKKGEKLYTVELIEERRSSKSSITSNATAASKKPQSTKAEGEITDAGGHKIVDRSLITHYSGNMKDIFKNIGIQPVKEGTDLKGFKVSFVKRGSHFDQLGLRRGDVIKSVNGQEVNSNQVGMDIYKNIDEMESMTLVIIRGKEEMELEYEIN